MLSGRNLKSGEIQCLGFHFKYTIELVGPGIEKVLMSML